MRVVNRLPGVCLCWLARAYVSIYERSIGRQFR